MRLIGAVAGIAALCAYAQVNPLADQARRLLQSRTLHDKAWGAWFAGSSHDAGLRQQLIAALRAAQSLKDARPDTDAYAYVQALFDALIETPGPVPSDIISPFAASWRPEVLILMSRQYGPGEESALLALREQQMPDADWAAVNDLLFGISSKPFFQRTLQEIRITHNFLIVDREVGMCGGTTACGASARKFPKGFPPVGLYQLQADAAPGDTLLLDRPVPIHYRRIVVPTDGEVEWNECVAERIPTSLRQTWLAQFLAALDWLTPQQAEQLFHTETTIHWRGAAQAAEEMQTLLDQQAASIQTLLGNAQRRELVNTAGMKLVIGASISDVRNEKSVAAPAVAPREITIR